MWQRPWFAYGAVFLGVCGHASSEFVAVLSGVSGPEVSVWRFLLGSSGLVLLALLTPAARNLLDATARTRPAPDDTVVFWRQHHLSGVSLGTRFRFCYPGGYGNYHHSDFRWSG